MSIKLFEHNQKAYEAAVEMLAETGKAAIIHPTGTGKSFIGFKYCEDNPDKAVCWLSPSRYIFETQIDNLEKTGVEIPKNIKFFTYKKLSLMTDEEICKIKCDAAILDEYHRGGALTWGISLKKFLENNLNVPIVGLSATNIRYLDNQRNMAEELFDGNIASEITLGDAIVRGILPAPKYIMTVFSYQKDLEKYTKKVNRTQNPDIRKKAEKYLEKLRRAIENADGIDEIFNKHMTDRTGKYIVFTQRADAMKECISHASEWFGKVDDEPHIYAVRTTEPETSTQLFEFINDKDTSHLRLLFCIDALNVKRHFLRKWVLYGITWILCGKEIIRQHYPFLKGRATLRCLTDILKTELNYIIGSPIFAKNTAAIIKKESVQLRKYRCSVLMNWECAGSHRLI